MNIKFFLLAFITILPGNFALEFTLDTANDLNDLWETTLTYGESIESLGDCIQNPALPANSDAGFWSLCGPRPVSHKIHFNIPPNFKIDTVYYTAYRGKVDGHISLEYTDYRGIRSTMPHDTIKGDWGNYEVLAKYYQFGENSKLTFSLYANGNDKDDAIMDKIRIVGQDTSTTTTSTEATTLSTEPSTTTTSTTTTEVSTTSTTTTEASTTSQVPNTSTEATSTTEASTTALPACVQSEALCQPLGSSSSSSSSSEEDREPRQECCGDLVCRKGRGKREKNKKQYQCRQR